MVIFRKVFYGICSSFAPLKLARWSNALCKLKYLTWLPLRPIEGQFVPARQIKTRRERENNTIVRSQQRTFSMEIELPKKWRLLCAFFFVTGEGSSQNQDTRFCVELLSPSPCFVCLALGSRMFFVLSLHCWSWAHNKPNCSTRTFSAHFRLSSAAINYNCNQDFTKINKNIL